MGDGTRLNRQAYEQLVEEDVAWVMRAERTLERDHVVMVLRDSVDRLYPRRPDPPPADRSAAGWCEHGHFASLVKVSRLTDGDGGPVTGYLAEVTVRCTECGTAFKFKGLPPGLNLGGAACDMDGREAGLAIEPDKGAS